MVCNERNSKTLDRHATCLVLTLSFYYALNDVNCRRTLTTFWSDTELQLVGKQRAVSLPVDIVLSDWVILTYTMPNESYQTYLCSCHVCGANIDCNLRDVCASWCAGREWRRSSAGVFNSSVGVSWWERTREYKPTTWRCNVYHILINRRAVYE